MPFIDRPQSIPPDLRSKLNAEMCYPVSNRFVRNLDPSRHQKIFNVTKAESKAMERPNHIADDQAWKTEALEVSEIRQI